MKRNNQIVVIGENNKTVERCNSIEEAKDAIYHFEVADKEAGVFTQDYYRIKPNGVKPIRNILIIVVIIIITIIATIIVSNCQTTGKETADMIDDEVKHDNEIA